MLGISGDGIIGEKPMDRCPALSFLLGKEVTDNSLQTKANELPLELRLVHHFICHIFIHKGGKFEYVSNKELFFLQAYMTEAKVDLANYILKLILKASKTKARLPYEIFLTKVFKHFKINLSSEKSRTPDSISDEYSSRTLARMRYHFDKDLKQWVKDKGLSSGGSATPRVRPMEQGQSFETQWKLLPMVIPPIDFV